MSAGMLYHRGVKPLLQLIAVRCGREWRLAAGPVSEDKAPSPMNTPFVFPAVSRRRFIGQVSAAGVLALAARPLFAGDPPAKKLGIVRLAEVLDVAVKVSFGKETIELSIKRMTGCFGQSGGGDE